MITVTKQELVDWINAQPTDRPVNMSENYSRYETGCVMVQYGKEVLQEDDFGCGFFCWEKNKPDGDRFAIIERNVDIYCVLSQNLSVQHQLRGVKTFGEIQKLICEG